MTNVFACIVPTFQNVLQRRRWKYPVWMSWAQPWDRNGKIKAYVGEGEFTDDPADTKGGVAVCHVKGLQNMMKYITKNGFEHHVAMNRSSVANVLEEAFGNYLGWEVYRHR